MGRRKEGSPEEKGETAVPLHTALTAQPLHIPTPGNSPRYQEQRRKLPQPLFFTINRKEN